MWFSFTSIFKTIPYVFLLNPYHESYWKWFPCVPIAWSSASVKNQGLIGDMDCEEDNISSFCIGRTGLNDMKTVGLPNIGLSEWGHYHPWLFKFSQTPPSSRRALSVHRTVYPSPESAHIHTLKGTAFSVNDISNVSSWEAVAGWDSEVIFSIQFWIVPMAMVHSGTNLCCKEQQWKLYSWNTLAFYLKRHGDDL